MDERNKNSMEQIILIHNSNKNNILICQLAKHDSTDCHSDEEKGGKGLV